MDILVVQLKGFEFDISDFLNDLFERIKIIFHTWSIFLFSMDILFVVQLKRFEFDISDFLNDLFERIKDSINLIRNNTYYQKLCSEISHRQMTGTIKLDDVFNINEDMKKEYFKFLSQEDIICF